MKSKALSFFKKQLAIVFCLLPFLCWGETQYKPISSVERHELSIGFSGFPDTSKGLLRQYPFLKYGIYFPEVTSFLPSDYQKTLIFGLQSGINVFQGQQKDDLCSFKEVQKRQYAGALHLGLKAMSKYFDFVQPFGEAGLAHSFCYSFSSLQASEKQLSYYYSLGLFLSFKFLDKSSIYSLDQDYGINDFGLRIEFLSYLKAFNIVQIGLQLSF